MKRILILGGAGFIGTNLTFKLLGEGYEVAILNRNNSNLSIFNDSPNKPEIFVIDLLDFSAVEEVIRKGNFDTVIHLISNLSPGSTFDEFLSESDINIKISCKLLHIVYLSKVKNFIYFSSGGTVYGNNGIEFNKENDKTNPISLYGWYKNAIEQYIQTYTYTHPVNFAILRASNPYGRFQNTSGQQGFIAVAMGNILNNKPVNIWGDGSVVRDYIYIDDLTELVSKLIKKGFTNNVFNLGTGEGYSLNAIIDILKVTTKKDFPVIYTNERSVDVKKNILDVSSLYDYLEYNGTENTPIVKGVQRMWDDLTT